MSRIKNQPNKAPNTVFTDCFWQVSSCILLMIIIFGKAN